MTFQTRFHIPGPAYGSLRPPSTGKTSGTRPQNPSRPGSSPGRATAICPVIREATSCARRGSRQTQATAERKKADRGRRHPERGRAPVAWGARCRRGSAPLGIVANVAGAADGEHVSHLGVHLILLGESVDFRLSPLGDRSGDEKIVLCAGERAKAP